MIHLVIIVRESQPVSPNFNHSKLSRISTIASLFLLLLIRHPLFSVSYWQVYQLPYNDSRMSNSHQGPPRQYQVFIPTFLWQKLSGGSEADPFDTRISQFFSIFWYKLHRQTDTMTGDSNNWRKLGGVEGETTWMERETSQKSMEFSDSIYARLRWHHEAKRETKLHDRDGWMAGWPKKRHVYYVWFIRSKPTNARGIIFCDDISPAQQRSCRSFAIIVLVVPLFLKLVNHRRNSPYLEKQQSPNMGSRRFLD